LFNYTVLETADVALRS